MRDDVEISHLASDPRNSNLQKQDDKILQIRNKPWELYLHLQLQSWFSNVRKISDLQQTLTLTSFASVKCISGLQTRLGSKVRFLSDKLWSDSATSCGLAHVILESELVYVGLLREVVAAYTLIRHKRAYNNQCAQSVPSA